MTTAKALKNCTPSEIQSYVAIVRLAAELREKDVFGAFDHPVEDLFDAIFQTVHLIHFASSIMEDEGDEENSNN